MRLRCECGASAVKEGFCRVCWRSECVARRAFEKQVFSKLLQVDALIRRAESKQEALLEAMRLFRESGGELRRSPRGLYAKNILFRERSDVR